MSERFTAAEAPSRRAAMFWSVILPVVVVFNTLVAVFLVVLDYGASFWANLWFSQCIGLSVCMSLFVGDRSEWAPTPRVVVDVLSVVVGTLVGIGIAIGGFAVSGRITLEEGLSGSRLTSLLLQPLAIGLLFGGAALYYTLSRERYAAAHARWHAERLRGVRAEKERVEMELRLLQAQVEPHFLFNTLAHVRALIDSGSTAAAGAMVDRLSEYLRGALRHARAEHTTLGAELEVLQRYLDILRVRMRDRLQVRIDVPDALRRRSLPPMLIQPLVENAVKHGLEPTVDGGELAIVGRREGQSLVLEVRDNGRGLVNMHTDGVGLANVRERLQALYGRGAYLELEANPRGGVVARLSVPDEGE